MPLTNIDITNRYIFSNGEEFGDVGQYEVLEGIASFEIDPLLDINTSIVDLELAERQPNGLVAFSSDICILQPVNPDKGNQRVLFDVVNRGRKTALSLNDVPAVTDHFAPLMAGNGFLMRKGYTVAWCGWQWDVPANLGLIGLHAPEALSADGPLEGKIMCQFQSDVPTQVFLLADRQHTPHPAADIDEEEATLEVRNLPNQSARAIDREDWSFVRVEDGDVEPDPSHIYLPAGFEPGLIYQLVYTTRGSTVVGLGFAAIRDFISFLKNATRENGNPCSKDLEFAYAFGRSQSGRFLRQMIHLGLNIDEAGQMALDGIIPHVGGGMRGEFNLRFGQPSKDVCYIIPELFPFTDTKQNDPVTGQSGGLLDTMLAQGQVPKIMFTNTSAEYWRGDAALIHCDLDTMSDATESSYVRRYHFAGCQHGAGVFPPEQTRVSDGLRGQLPFNSVDYTPLLRAALINLDNWVSTGTEPPASRHPSLDRGTAVESKVVMAKFVDLPGLRTPPELTRAMRLYYGDEVHLGRTTVLPAEEGDEFPALVSDIDESFNELDGIRLPDLTVPVATYTGWNLRHESIGNPDLFIGITGGLAGSTLALPKTKEERINMGDPRLSIEERYESKSEYLRDTERDALVLIEKGYLLEEDLQPVIELAARKYDYFSTLE